jgi:flagellar basal-body rod protein FlgG
MAELMSAIQTAAGAMGNSEIMLQVIAHNLANQSTAGYQQFKPILQDIGYQTIRPAGTASSEAGNLNPTAIQIGNGAKVAAIARITAQGGAVDTQNPLDLLIKGGGYFQIEHPKYGIAYTRSGRFSRDANGTMVNMDGFTLAGGITFPPDTVEVSINGQGEVYASQDGQTTPTKVGQIDLATFANPQGLEAREGTLFVETAASGPAITGVPGSIGLGGLQQGFYEGSNVKSVQEITGMLETQRLYEQCAKVIQAASNMWEKATSVA